MKTLFDKDLDLPGYPCVISDCGAYRYALWRVWKPQPRRIVMFLMLNPSTANAMKNDPTIQRCIGFAKSWSFDGLCVGNLFALRSPKPKALLAASDPVGPENDVWLSRLRDASQLHVAAYGSFPNRGRDKTVRAMFQLRPLMCLGLTGGGYPRHPLFVPSCEPLMELP